MILETKEKSPFGGKDIFVPNFLTMPINDRNKVHRYAGRYSEDKSESFLPSFGGPLIMLVPVVGMLVGCGMNNGTVVLAFCLPMLVLLFGVLCWGIISALIGPKKPDTLIIQQDDVRWSMLLVAFSDNQRLWERLTRVLKNGGYIWNMGLHWYMRYATPLMRELDNIVSAFMTSSNPTIEDAMIVRRDVDQIFAKYAQKELDVETAREAAREIKAASDEQLFEFKVQMARADASRHTITTGMLPLIDEQATQN